MDSAHIRRRFLAYFAARDHTIVPSAPLVPDDPTLLFTNAGMVQFKDTFLGLDKRAYVRAASSQKCMRVSGKHNDLENVGPSARHHTFFEMLGNFSFGDYFKAEAIELAWGFLTGELGISPDRLIITVHRDDGEALDHWTKGIGLAPERVLPMGDKTNLWMMADVGPCGPTSELHYDFGPEHCTCGRSDCSVALDNDCGRWLELWNLVFMQYDQAPDGSRSALPAPGVDTGMGFERLTAVMQGVYSNYETDLFQPIMTRVRDLCGHSEAQAAAHQTAYRVLADHGRAMAFLVADGVLPGNEGRSYVLRLIMRRAMRFGRLMGLDGPFIAEVAQEAVRTMGDAYPELVERSAWIGEVVTEEEARFARTLTSGLEMLDSIVDSALAAGQSLIGGEDAFRLYDTFGFPPDLTETVAQERGLHIDHAAFDAAMARQRERARSGAAFEVESATESYRRAQLPEVRFVGYDALSSEGCVMAIRIDGQVVEHATAGEAAEIVLDVTPFYAEAGGQVADTGMIEGAEGTMQVADTQAPVPGLIVHRGPVQSGRLAVGDTVRARIDVERRYDIMRNHTVTHLLHRALQEVLGAHAQQRGSLVAPGRVRFDFAHLKALSADELAEVERRVNDWVRRDRPVRWEYLPIEEARARGATMLFGEKYSDTVRMVEVEDVSRELCGGTHLRRTGQIGLFLIAQESSIGAGLRRIEALTGRGAEAHVRQQLGLLQSIAEQVGTPTPDGISARVTELQARVRQLTRDLATAEGRLASEAARDVAQRVVDAGVPLLAERVEASSPEALRGQVDILRERLTSGVIVLGAVIDGRPRLVAAVSEDLVANGLSAGRIVKEAAALMGGSGGGRPALAEAGGRDPAQLGRALAETREIVRRQVSA